MKPTLHLLGIFHTQSSNKFSHCAFTGKALRFPKMMQMAGYKVIEYSNAGSQSTADEHVEMLSLEEYEELFGARKKTDFYGDAAYVGSPAHSLFEQRLIPAMKERVKPRDIICHPFGHSHSALLGEFPGNQHVETGIGYPTLMDNSFRIFESYAWMHYHQGKEGRNGVNYEWVIPNYFDIEEWEPSYKQGDYIAFLGRICPVKGMDTVLEIARRVPYPIKIAGQGDPTPWNHPNIEYIGPISGKERSDFLRNARCAVMPTVFTEPFGGSGVEAMLCGTPLIAVDFGAFTETVVEGVTGFRCRTLADWLDAVDKVGDLDRKQVADIARSRYSLQACATKYDKVFSCLYDLYDKGWYSCDEVLDYNKTLESLRDQEIFFACVGAMDGASHDGLFQHAHANKNWKGILVEPVQEYFEQLKENYDNRDNLIFENVAIAEEEGEKEIYRIPSEIIGTEVPEWANGISTFLPNGGAIQGLKDKTVTETVSCVKYSTLVSKHNITRIDVLQIDAEGYDYEIFSQIWETGVRPRLINIEVVRMNLDDQKHVRELLLSEGYKLKREGDNWIAVKENPSSPFV